MTIVSGCVYYTTDTSLLQYPSGLFCGKSGDIWRLDNAACPTLDCLYVDCHAEGRALKVYNNKGDSVALAIFNMSAEKVKEKFTFDVIPALCPDREYVAYEYFTKTYKRISGSTEESFALDVDGVLSYSIYPIEKDGDGEYIMMGDTGRYVGIGDRDKKRVALKDIL